MGTPVVIPSISAASAAANDWYQSLTGQRNPTSMDQVQSTLSAIGAGISQSSGSPVATSTSAVGQYDLDSLMTRLEGLAGQNTALSAQQAEDLRRWQEIQNAKAMEFNSAEAAKNRDWQKMMSDTAHQREIADLQAAGLNPVLSAMGGQGAYVGSGATASGVSSAGGQGQVDTSSSMGLVQLLGSLLASQTSLANAALSAQTQTSIADKTNAVNQLIATLTGQFGLARESLAGEYGLKKQYESDVWSNWRTGQTTAASRYASDQSYAASALASALGLEGTKYSADSHLKGTKYSADQSLTGVLQSALYHLQGTQYSADKSAMSSMYGSNKSYQASQNRIESEEGIAFWRNVTDILEAVLDSDVLAALVQKKKGKIGF